MGNSNFMEIMKLERIKAVNNAIAELDTALYTFYNNMETCSELNKIKNELVKFKEDYLS